MPKAEIKVLSDGSLYLDGQRATLESIDQHLAELAQSTGVVWYYREAGELEPPPVAMKVLDLVIKHGLPISMSSRPDFTDVIDEHGVSRLRATGRAIVSSVDYEARAPRASHALDRYRGSVIGWLLAFFFFPYGPFVYLGMLRAISVRATSAFLVVTLALHVGSVAALSATNFSPWQPLLILAVQWLFGWVLVAQYIIGQRAGVWSRAGRVLWLCAAVLFCTALAWQIAIMARFGLL